MTQHRAAVLLTVLFVAYCYGWFWPALAAVGLAVFLWWFVPWYLGWLDAEHHRRQQIIARADEQHNLAMQGDPRGVYGQAWPQVRTYERAQRRQGR